MKVAVTGATGFIGRYVVEELLRQQAEVVATSSRSPAAGVFDERVRHVPLDLATADDAFERFGRPDAVIHLAWAGLPNYKSTHHYETHLAEQYRFLKQLVVAGLPSLLCIGTCFEYGMRSGELTEDLPADPQNPYGFAKDALRRELMFLRSSTGFAFTWVRLFYMYGERQAANSLYPQLMAAGRSGQTSFRMSRGEQLRDYLPVTQIAAHIAGLALRCPNAGIVNVCSGRPVSVRALVEQWLVDNGWTLQLELGFYPYPDYEPMAFWGSNRRLTSLLGGS